MTERIGDFAHQTRLADMMGATRARVRGLETDVVTGKSTRSFAEIPQDTGLLLRTREQLASARSFIAQNERLTNEIQVMDGALGSIVSMAERLRTLLVQRLNDPTGQEMPLDIEAAAMLEEVVASLNTTSDGRYLFAGTATDRRPVTLPPAPLITDNPTLYYAGDGRSRTVWLDRDVAVGLPARADDPAFAQLIAALGTAVAAHGSGDRAQLESALTRAEQALAGVVELRSRIGAVASRVVDVTEHQRDTVLYLDETRAAIEDTDIAAAMTGMAQDKVAIEASYLLVSQISSLSLVDYLR